MKTNQGSCLWPCGLIVQISRKKCRTFLDLVSFKAFLRRFSSFSSSLTSDSSALLWGDLLVWSNYNHLSKVAKKSGWKSWILGVPGCNLAQHQLQIWRSFILVLYQKHPSKLHLSKVWYYIFVLVFAYCTNRTFCIVPTEHVSCWQLESVTVCKDWFFLKIWSKAGQL